MDADDVAHPDRLKLQLNFMENNPHIDISGTSAIGVNTITNNRFMLDVPQSHEHCIDYLYAGLNPFIHPSIIAKRSIFETCLYDTSFESAEDYDLFFRLAKTNHIFGNLIQPLLLYNTTGVYHDKYIYATSRSFYIHSLYNHTCFESPSASPLIALQLLLSPSLNLVSRKSHLTNIFHHYLCISSFKDNTFAFLSLRLFFSLLRNRMILLLDDSFLLSSINFLRFHFNKLAFIVLGKLYRYICRQYYLISDYKVYHALQKVISSF